jgi:hypothetical protein
LRKGLKEFMEAGRTATWRSGYAEVCKTFYPGSIPGVASSKINDLGAVYGAMSGRLSSRQATLVRAANASPFGSADAQVRRVRHARTSVE